MRRDRRLNEDRVVAACRAAALPADQQFRYGREIDRIRLQRTQQILVGVRLDLGWIEQRHGETMGLETDLQWAVVVPRLLEPHPNPARVALGLGPGEHNGEVLKAALVEGELERRRDDLTPEVAHQGRS